MKIFAILFLTVFAAMAAPELVCDSPELDFGTITDTAPVRLVFGVRNRGDRTAVIGEVKTSCGCAAARLGERVLLPGSSVELEVIFDPRGRRGKQHKTIRVIPEEGHGNELELALTGFIEPEIWVTPSSLWLAVRPGEKIKRELLIEFREPQKKPKIECSVDWLAADIEEVKKGRIFRLNVSGMVPPGISRFKGEIVLFSSDQPSEKIRIPVRGIRRR